MEQIMFCKELNGKCQINMFAAVAFVLSCSISVFAGGNTNWPDFRGPGANGISDVSNVPIAWSETENVKWKTAIHDEGHSSPVVWKDQVWLTTADKKGRKMYAVCIDINTGRIVHDILIFEVDKPDRINGKNTFATCSPVIEAGRVYLHFGTYGTACLDTVTGKTVWSRQDLNCKHIQGPGSSPVIYKDLLICHMDGYDVRYIAALNKLTGKTVWKTYRSNDIKSKGKLYQKAHNSPLIVKVDDQVQLISSNSMACMSYDPLTGRELWKVIHEVDGTVMRPVFADGVVYISAGDTPKKGMWAVRANGKGNITDTNVLWKCAKDGPFVSSPILHDGLLYMTTDRGLVSCLDAKTGVQLWQKKLSSGTYWSSAVYADGQLYFSNDKGSTTVMAAGRTARVIGINKLDDGIYASPAVVEGGLILRTTTHLYCFGNLPI